MSEEEAAIDACLKWRVWFNSFCDRFYAEKCATTLLEYVRFAPELPIRLKNQQPPKRRIADFL